jgi:hypothetical protein
MAVTLVSTGAGLTGGPITSTGTISLLPPTGGNLGGVKAGANVTIAPDGTISVAPPNPGTITGVTVGGGLLGGGSSGNVVVAVNFASAAEVIAGTVNFKPITPQTLAAKVASTTARGLVQLSDSFQTVDSTRAATSTAVKSVYDVANAALSRSGGVMTGPIVFSSNQAFSGVNLPVATTTSPGVVIPSAGLAVSSSGYLTTVNNGTVTSVVAGRGLGAPVSGNAITSTGTIQLLPPSSDGSTIGGVKAGPNIRIEVDGQITTDNVLQTNNPYAYNSYIWPATTSPIPAAPGDNGNVLTLLDKVTGEVGWTRSGTISEVVAGTGVTSSTVSGTATISLATVPSITPGNVGGTALIPTLAVNAQGQITSMGLANPFAPFETPTVTAPFVLVLDFDGNSTNWQWVLQGNTTVQNPLNAVSGQTGSLLITQNSLNTHTITWGDSWKFANFSPFTGAGLGEVTMLKFTVVAANYIVVTNKIENIG